MKPIDEKLAKLANKAHIEIKANDRSKEEKQAYDKGFVTGVLSIALEFELDKEEVASFLEDRRVLDKAIELLESKRPHGKWVHREDMDYLDENKVMHIHYMCKKCGFIHDFIDGHTSQHNFCPNCGAEMEVENDERRSL